MRWMALNARRKRVSINRGIIKTLVAVVAALQLVACGGGGGGGSGSAISGSGSATTAGGTSAAASASSSGSSRTTSPSGSSATTSPSGSGQTATSAPRSLVLSWVAPVARADGTPLLLSDIDGFRIYYGNSAGNYTHSVNVADGTTQQVTLNNLTTGTYYIVMTTYDIDGRESGNSAVVRTTVF